MQSSKDKARQIIDRHKIKNRINEATQRQDFEMVRELESDLRDIE